MKQTCDRGWTMGSKKKMAGDRAPVSPRRRPAGMQQMGPKLYQQLKLALRELTGDRAAAAH